jgi:hypothetical protein
MNRRTRASSRASRIALQSKSAICWAMAGMGATHFLMKRTAREGRTEDADQQEQ